MAGLPWIRAYTSIRTDPRSLVLGRLLGDSHAYARILDLRLWLADNSPSGRIEGPHAAIVVEEAVGWRGEPGAFAKAAADAGFLRESPAREGRGIALEDSDWGRWMAGRGDGVDLGPPSLRLLTDEEREIKRVENERRAQEWREGEAERRGRIRGKPHVYFIQQGDSGAIKIGCSKNPAQRLAALQTGHSEPLRLLTCAVGSQAQERALHDRFAHLRVSGEWFRPADELLAYIRLVTDRRAL